jgi:hypothetical protein
VLGVPDPATRLPGLGVTLIVYVVTGVGGLGVAGVPPFDGSVGESDWQPIEAASATAQSRWRVVFSGFIPMLLKKTTARLRS